MFLKKGISTPDISQKKKMLHVFVQLNFEKSYKYIHMEIIPKCDTLFHIFSVIYSIFGILIFFSEIY